MYACDPNARKAGTHWPDSPVYLPTPHQWEMSQNTSGQHLGNDIWSCPFTFSHMSAHMHPNIRVPIHTWRTHIQKFFFSGWALWQEHTYLDFMPWVLFPYLKPGPQKSTSTMLGLGGGSIWTSWEIKTASPSSYRAVPWAVHVLLLARPPLPPGPGPRLLILRGVTGIEHTFRQLKALRQMSKHKTSDNSVREQEPASSRVMCQFKNKT